MAWGRILDVYVGTRVDDPKATTQGATTTQVTGINPDTGEQSLDCSVEITRSNRMKYNTAVIKIYNANQQLRTSMELPGQVVRVDAGYEKGGKGTVFYGQCGSVESVLEGADWVTTINAYHFRAVNLGFETLYVSLGYAVKANLKQVISDLGVLLGVAVIGMDNADIILENGWTYAGSMKGALAYVRQKLRYYGRDLFYDLAELVVYAVGSETSQFEAVYLDLESGLLEAHPVVNPVREQRAEIRDELTQQKKRQAYDKSKSADGRTRIAQSMEKETAKHAEDTRKRIKFKALLNPRIRPNCIVQIDHPACKGVFIVDDITIRADNFGGEFVLEGGASRAQ